LRNFQEGHRDDHAPEIKNAVDIRFQ
jgi:hypothetical protein